MRKKMLSRSVIELLESRFLLADVIGLTLYNADTDQPIAGFNPMPQGATLNLATLPTRNLSITASTSPATVGSVRFNYDGNANYRMENIAPYAIAGDDSGNLTPWTPTVGSHSLILTAYDGSQGTGAAGPAFTYNFTVVDNPTGPVVSITTPDANASEQGPDSASFTISRTGSTASALTVNFSIGGSAVNGVDYQSRASSATIPVGASSISISITPINDTLLEGTETVTFSLLASANYNVGGSNSASVFIADNDGFGALINFQPSGAPVPSGYLADTGLVYGNRGNGLSYGWDQDNTANTRDRNAPNSPDQRYDTLNHMQLGGANRVWELGIPNGVYSVRIVAGDPSFYDSVFRINVEGTLAVSGTPSVSTPWVESTVSATVADGRLTISNGTGSSNNKIAFIEVSSATNSPTITGSRPSNGQTNIARDAFVATDVYLPNPGPTVTAVKFSPWATGSETFSKAMVGSVGPTCVPVVNEIV